MVITKYPKSCMRGNPCTRCLNVNEIPNIGSYQVVCKWFVANSFSSADLAIFVIIATVDEYLLLFWPVCTVEKANRYMSKFPYRIGFRWFSIFEAENTHIQSAKTSGN